MILITALDVTVIAKHFGLVFMKNVMLAAFAYALFAQFPAQAGNCGGGAHAHNPQEMASKFFDQMDLNGDATVTKAEFEASPVAKAVKSFDSLQPNESGLVTKKTFIEIFVKTHPMPKNEV
jgi:hypothetical protein